jgi:hypothetical protein
MRGCRLKRALVGLSVLIVALTPMALVLWPRPEGSKATAANWDRIRDGMTINEVEEILGPPGEYRTDKMEKDENDFSLSNYERLSAERIRPLSAEIWRTDTANGFVLFHHDRVTEWVYSPAKDDTPSKRFVRKMTRQWHRWFPEK